MKVVLPRVIRGNRGDLASRWGLLYALQSLDFEDVTVFAQSKDEIPELSQTYFPYGKVHNLIQTRDGLQALRQSDTVLWSVGLDLQDDSSLAKLSYLTLAFWMYRSMGLRIRVLYQGAGPLETRLGKLLAKQVLHSVDLFVSRDPGTFKLVNSIHPKLNNILGHDAIFLPNLEQDLSMQDEKRGILADLIPKDGRPLVGFNIRQWFHFSSSILPYQFSKKKYLLRSQEQMTLMLRSAVQVVQDLQKQSRVLLISAYQPGSIPWEDDLHWLAQVKAEFQENANVILIDRPISIPTYFDLMSQLDLMIGMRLHSSLIALRLGVPSLNISYTLKGRDIMSHLGLSKNVVELAQFIASPEIITQRALQILDSGKSELILTKKAVDGAIEQNMNILHQIFGV